MGFWSDYKEKAAKTKRLNDAADQLWYHVSRGSNLEVPLHLNAKDDFIQAIAIMQRKHPEVTARMYQSKGIVVGLHKPGVSMDVSDQAFELLKKGGHIAQASPMNIEAMLVEHERFLISQGLNPVEQERLAQEERMARAAITVGQQGSAERGEGTVPTPPGESLIIKPGGTP